MHVLRGLMRPVGLMLAAAALPFAARAADPPPLSAYGQLPGVEDMALSESGTLVAAIATINGERLILIMNDQRQPIRKFAVGDVKVRSIEWVGDERLLVQVSQTEELGYGFTADQYEFWRALVIPIDRSAGDRIVFGNDHSLVNAVFGNYGLRRLGEKWVAYFGGIEVTRSLGGHAAPPHYRPALFAVDLASNGEDRIAQPAGENQDIDWLIRPDGTVGATFTIDTHDGEWTIKGDRGRLLAEGNAPRGDAGLISLGADGTSVIYAEEQQGETQWFEVPLDGSAPPSVFRAGEDIGQLFIDRASGRLLGILKGGPEARPEFFSPEHQAVVRKVYAAFRQLDVQLVDWTLDFSRVLVRTSGNGDSGTWYLVDIAELRAEAVGWERPRVPGELVGRISAVAYKAGDGLDLDGILTLPPGREGKNLPLIVLPHGGPASHDEVAFDWWAQAFASRGYAVFQPNFRGSTNRDDGFIRAGYGQWGRKMQSDISDGVAELTRQGIVDPKRACIVGASYGGYAALAGVTLQQGLYRCAAAVAGVSDLALMYRTDYRESGEEPLLRRSLLEELGPRSGFDEVSPRRFAAQADAPILLIHGRDDTVVPFEQSAKMADALKDAGKPYRLIELRDEDHWLSRGTTRMQMLEATMAFVQEHNPAD